ncbi:MT-A70 family protein [Oxytricha trifallax]|uniref:mRNA m(6)A methyltransferase n=1 Tax=Oxytricha trifallax TaxID=1172189 RepID=A0A073I0Y6_9SPIT|nr:MT-A70 family protein [Oxytricha trifallax]
MTQQNQNQTSQSRQKELNNTNEDDTLLFQQKLIDSEFKTVFNVNNGPNDAQILPRNDEYIQDLNQRITQLEDQILNKNKLNHHLLKFSQLIESNKRSKDHIIRFLKYQNFSMQQIQSLKNSSKQHINTIEFTSEAIEKELNSIFDQEKLSKIDKEYFSLELINKLIQFFLEIVAKFQNYFERLLDGNQQSVEQTLQQCVFINTDYMMKQLNDSEEFKKKVANQYMDSMRDLNMMKRLCSQLELKQSPIAINCDVFQDNVLRTIGETQQFLFRKKFDVLEVDYPWAINFETNTGSNFLPYETEGTKKLFKLGVEDLQDNGFIFMWTVSQKFVDAIAFLLFKGYRIVDQVVWVKKGIKAELKNRQGYYLRHSKEICLVGLKGKEPEGTVHFKVSDIIESVPGGNSEKPVEIKKIIERMVPNGMYCEIFGRKNNLRHGWVTIGNELG